MILWYNETFSLHASVMKPYSKQDMTEVDRIYNYKLPWVRCSGKCTRCACYRIWSIAEINLGP